jgi:hypothetical protein
MECTKLFRLAIDKSMYISVQVYKSGQVGMSVNEFAIMHEQKGESNAVGLVLCYILFKTHSTEC